MNKLNRFENIQYNPKTHAAHRKETFWQIFLPLFIGFILILAVVVGVILSAAQPVSEVSRYAAVSIIWLLMPALFFTLLLIVLLAALVVAVSMLMRVVPRFAAIALLYLDIGREKVFQFSNALVEPIVKARATWAAVRWIGKRGR